MVKLIDLCIKENLVTDNDDDDDIETKESDDLSKMLQSLRHMLSKTITFNGDYTKDFTPLYEMFCDKRTQRSTEQRYIDDRTCAIVDCYLL